ncbi:hypothetical protein [Paenibacillus xylaniclasticus]|uniref:hypothetical protein n=1 Tax=Paenibacillus xylaniclasticus TaxID=588083 RepID=UPI000FDA0F1C|nr:MULTISPECIES: hypothetical protein [Paenibacillus]GFN30945.1 hypothetical protein PCURB6_12050 [Paenibacillus curdlanolyticus]
MGGKSKLLDERLLEKLYEESNIYDQQANENVRQLKSHVSALADRTILHRLPDNQAEVVKDAVEQLDRSVESLKESLTQMRRYIDMKLAGAVSFSERSDEAFKPLILSGHVKALSGIAGLKK